MTKWRVFLPGGALIVHLFNLLYWVCLNFTRFKVVLCSIIVGLLWAWFQSLVLSHQKYNFRAALLLCHPLTDLPFTVKTHCSSAWCVDHWREHLSRLPCCHFPPVFLKWLMDVVHSCSCCVSCKVFSVSHCLFLFIDKWVFLSIF